MEGQPKKPRGFAVMDSDRQREIASKGGRSAHQLGTAHKYTSEEARIAGKKGGASISQNLAHMRDIGRRGGKASSLKRMRDQGVAQPPGPH